MTSLEKNALILTVLLFFAGVLFRVVPYFQENNGELAVVERESTLLKPVEDIKPVINTQEPARKVKKDKQVKKPSKKVDIKVDVNRAAIHELAKVRGIGATLAANIVEYRDAHGGFKAIDELLLVRGIGKKKLQTIANQITFGK